MEQLTAELGWSGYVVSVTFHDYYVVSHYVSYHETLKGSVETPLRSRVFRSVMFWRNGFRWSRYHTYVLCRLDILIFNGSILSGTNFRQRCNEI